MIISIYGMGYVGVVSAACLLKKGHHIIGIDPVIEKIEKLLKGESSIQEPEVSELLFDGYRKNLFLASIDPETGINKCDMIWVCVGTPSMFGGEMDFSHVDAVIKDIGRALRKIKNRPLIVIRSTCSPGTMKNRIKPLLEKESNLIVNKDIDLVFHPEFLREGMAVEDFNNPPKIVVGEDRKNSSNILLNIYKDYKVPCFRMNFVESEMVKYCDNLFHALKITFANEVASISNFLDIDSRKIADVYCSDKKLNISSYYLRPGPPYGGSCLPKELRTILKLASVNSIKLPMLNGIVKSNKVQIENIISRILSYKVTKIGIIGIAFKPDTDDMRESPYVEIAKALIGEGIELKVYDKFVNIDKLIGSNKKQIEKMFRNLNKLLVSSIDDLLDVDLILINHNIIDANCVMEWIKMGIKVIDLVNIEGIDRAIDGYEGLYW